MGNMLEQFEKIGSEALEAIKKIKDASSLEQFRIEYLSRKGKLTFSSTVRESNNAAD